MQTNSFVPRSLCLLFCSVWLTGGVPTICSTATSVPAQKTPAGNPKEWFQKGQQALQTGNLEEAERDFRLVLSIDPKSGAAYANLGVIEMRRKNWDEALKNLRKAQTLSPNIPGIRLNIGLVEFRKENYRDAIPILQSVVRDEPTATQPRYLLGLSQVFTEDYAGAVETLKPMWDSTGNDVMYLYVLDMAADKSGDKRLDEKVTKQMASVGSNTAEFHLILAKAHLQHHENDAALEELKKVEVLNPAMPFLHFNFGYAYLGTGDYVKSEAEFRKDIAIDPDLADNYYQLGVLYSLMQRPAESEEAYIRALKLDPHRPGAWFGLAKLYNEQGNYPAALSALDEALKASPDSGKVHAVRAQVLQRMGRKEEAKAEFALSKKLMDQKLSKDREDLEELLVPNPELKTVPN
jgi:tetratricopeptide (TPR) repeat protein